MQRIFAGTILYRAAEMLETPRRQLESELSRVDSSADRARRESDEILVHGHDRTENRAKRAIE